MKALVTGAEGFVGPHLVRFLKSQGLSVFCTSRKLDSDVDGWYEMDITDKSRVLDVFGEVRPDLVFHLAGFSSVGQSFKQPELCKRINVDGTRNVLDAVAALVPDAKVLVVSSAEVYADAGSGPVKEAAPRSAKSPYGESRLAQEDVCVSYSKEKGIFIIISRSFNHTGPGQLDVFALPSFAKQIVKIENGEQDCLKVGNLDVIRDFSDVRDVVRAYYLLLMEGESGEAYNVCSGKGTSLKVLLDILVRKSRAEVRIETDPERMRPADIPVLIGDNSKLKQATGWTPEISIEQTLDNLLDFFRKAG